MKKTLKIITITIVILFNTTNQLYALVQNQENQRTTVVEKDTEKSRSMVDIGLTEKNRELIAQVLNKLLANEYVLYTKTLKYHWNVKGKHFGSLHMLFQNQYEQLFKFIDRIGERSLALGFETDGTLTEFLNNSILNDQTGKNLDEKIMLKNLLTDHEIIIKQLRELANQSEQVNDWGTNNLTGELIEKHEKIAWMLRAHLQK